MNILNKIIDFKNKRIKVPKEVITGNFSGSYIFKKFTEDKFIDFDEYLKKKKDFEDFVEYFLKLLEKTELNDFEIKKLEFNIKLIDVLKDYIKENFRNISVKFSSDEGGLVIEFVPNIKAMILNEIQYRGMKSLTLLGKELYEKVRDLNILKVKGRNILIK